MGDSLKAILQLFVIASAITAATFWFGGVRMDQDFVWGARWVSTLFTLAGGTLVFRAAKRKDKFPDFLSWISDRYFERNGLCFTLQPAIRDGQCLMTVYFQNRYECACSARIIMRPPQKSFRFTRLALPTLDVEIECDGGAIGRVMMVYLVPPQFQGRKIRFEVAADTSYPMGSGMLLRFKPGMRVGGISTVSGALVTAGLLMAGHVHIKTPAKYIIKLPTGVASELNTPLEPKPRKEILWRPGDPLESVTAKTLLHI